MADIERFHSEHKQVKTSSQRRRTFEEIQKQKIEKLYNTGVSQIEARDDLGFEETKFKMLCWNTGESAEQVEGWLSKFEEGKVNKKIATPNISIIEESTTIPISEEDRAKLMGIYTTLSVAKRAYQLRYPIGIATTAALEAINWLAGWGLPPGTITKGIWVPIGGVVAMTKGGDLLGKGVEKAMSVIGRRALKSVHNAREERLQNPERQIANGNKRKWFSKEVREETLPQLSTSFTVIEPEPKKDIQMERTEFRNQPFQIQRIETPPYK
jgi:hypothetical protein